MKLSERLKDELWAKLIDEIKQLEADSQMLDGLIEMMSKYRISGIDRCLELYDYYGNEHSKYCSSVSMRAAIAAAIKEWKKEK